MRIEGEYINVNDLYGSVTDGSGGKTKGMSYNNSKARYAEINGIVKYDHWITVIEASNTDVSADGGYVSDLVDIASYGIDYKEEVHQMKESGDLTFSTDYIPKNTETSTKTHSVTITQVKSGKSVTVILTQAAAADKYEMVVTSVSASQVGAGGGTSSLTIRWAYRKNGVTQTSGTASPTSISGYDNSTGSYVSGTSVRVPSAGTTYYGSGHVAYYVTSFTFYANGSSHTFSRSVPVYRSANTFTQSTQYSVSCGSASVSSISASGGTFTFTATCRKKTDTEYSSGSVVTGTWVGATGNVTFSNGVTKVSPTSFTDSATITATVGANSGSSRDPRVTVTASGTSVSDYTQVTQAQADTYVFSIYDIPTEIEASDSKVTIEVLSTKNGSAHAFDASNVSVRIDGSLQSTSIVSVSRNGSTNRYYVVLNIGTNASQTSTRSITGTITQIGSGNTLDFSVTQKKVEYVGPTYWIGITQVSQTINGTFTDYTDYQYSDNAFAAVDAVWFKATIKNNGSTPVTIYASELYGQGYSYSGEWMNVSMSDRMRNSSKTLVNYVTLSGNSSTTVYFLWNNIGAHNMPSDDVFYLDFMIVDDDGNYVSDNVNFVMAK